MLNNFLLMLITISYCTYAIAAEPNSSSSHAEPALQSEQINQDLSSGKVSITPPLTTAQMLIKLKEAEGQTVRIDKKGNILSNDTDIWDCVYQKSSGLTWEVKTIHGLRDKTNTYTWVAENPDQDNLLSWFENIQGKCTGEAHCETSDYIAKINKLNLCNFSDWRLPSRSELESLITMNRAKEVAKIDPQYFPNTIASWYWTADSHESHPEFAWYVLFKNGITLSDKKHNPKHLRLVRGTL